MSEPAVRVEIRDRVAHVILNRPEKRNAINDEIVDGLYAALGELQTNFDVRVIVLSGAGKMFSSGVDATWLAQLGGIEAEKLGVLLRIMIARIQGLNNLIEQIEKPVICRIHGRCQGLALEIALACDFRIAAEDATLALPEVVLGMIPDCGGTTRVTRIAGPAVAKEVVMLGEPLPARRYYDWNLVHRVVPPESLDATVAELAALLIDRPAAALGMAKRLVDRGAGLDKMTHMELEALHNSYLIGRADFVQTLMEGFQKLKGKG